MEYATLQYKPIPPELAEHIRDWRVIQDHDNPTLVYVHSPDETVPGTFGPVYAVRYVNGKRKLARHATAKELAWLREETRKRGEAASRGTRQYIAEHKGGW